MPRIAAHIFTQREFPCGRLVPIQADYDSAEKVAEFVVPSFSRGDRVYGVTVDFVSLECACKCEAFSDFRETSRMPYRKDVGGAYLEQLAGAKGYRLAPLITRPRRFLCPHLKRVQDYLKRHGFWPHIQTIEATLIARAEALPKKVA